MEEAIEQNYSSVDVGVVQYVDWRLENVDVDMNTDDYYNKEEMDQLLADISAGGFIDLATYAKKTELDNFYTKSYITEFYLDRNDIEGNYHDNEYMATNFYTRGETNNEFYNKTYIQETYTSRTFLQTYYLTVDQMDNYYPRKSTIESEYYNKAYIDANTIMMPYLNDNYFNKTQIINDYYTKGWIDANMITLTLLTDDYYTKAWIDANMITLTLLTNDYYTKAWINANTITMTVLTNNYYDKTTIDGKLVPYQTLDQVKSAISDWWNVKQREYYTRDETNQAISTAIAGLSGGGGGASLNLTNWEHFSQWGYGPWKAYMRPFKNMFIAVDDSNFVFVIRWIPDYNEMNYGNATSEPCYINRIVNNPPYSLWGWCKGVRDEAYLWSLGITDPYSMTTDLNVLQAIDLVQNQYRAYPKFFKVATANNGMLFFNEMLRIQIPSQSVNTDQYNYYAVDAGKSCYMIVWGFDQQTHITFWDVMGNPDGTMIWSRRATLYDCQLVVGCRMIDKNNGVVCYSKLSNYIVQTYHYFSYASPTVVSTADVTLQNPRKVFIFNNKLCVAQFVPDTAPPDPNRLWIANDVLHPIGGTVYDLPEKIYKMKVLYEHLFVVREDQIQYTNDGVNWKSIYYPYTLEPIDSSLTKLFANDSKVYIVTNRGSYWADIFGSSTANAVMNTTITHNAPLGHGETLDNFTIGEPVYMTGTVAKFDDIRRTYKRETDATNCISSVKSRGGVREYLGICSGKFRKGERNIGQDTIEFATHGDCYFAVDSADDYEVGDVVLMDKKILGEDVVVTGLIRRMIVGTVTAKINSRMISVLMD
jgi:hypothetical protein